jgi:hypothetical protein
MRNFFKQNAMLSVLFSLFIIIVSCFFYKVNTQFNDYYFNDSSVSTYDLKERELSDFISHILNYETQIILNEEFTYRANNDFLQNYNPKYFVFLSLTDLQVDDSKYYTVYDFDKINYYYDILTNPLFLEKNKEYDIEYLRNQIIISLKNSLKPSMKYNNETIYILNELLNYSKLNKDTKLNKLLKESFEEIEQILKDAKIHKKTWDIGEKKLIADYELNNYILIPKNEDGLCFYQKPINISLNMEYINDIKFSFKDYENVIIDCEILKL